MLLFGTVRWQWRHCGQLCRRCYSLAVFFSCFSSSFSFATVSAHPHSPSQFRRLRQQHLAHLVHNLRIFPSSGGLMKIKPQAHLTSTFRIRPPQHLLYKRESKYASTAVKRNPLHETSAVIRSTSLYCYDGNVGTVGVYLGRVVHLYIGAKPATYCTYQ